MLPFGDGPKAADRAITTSIEVVKEYNDNVLLDTEKKSDFIIRIKPKVQATNETEVSKVQLDVALNGEKYIKNPSLDFMEVNSQLALSRMWSPRFTTALTGFFKRDATLEAELLASGIPTLRQERLTYGADLSGTYALTENWSIKAGVTPAYTEYPDGLLPNSTTIDGYVDQTWQLAPRTAVGVLGKYTVAQYQDVPSTIQSEKASNKNLQGSVYWRHQYDENTSIEASAGYRYTWIEQNVTSEVYPDGIFPVFYNVPVNSTDGGFIFGLTVNRNLSEKLSTSVSAGQEQYNATNATSAQRTYIRSAFNYKLTEKASIDFSPGFDYTTEGGTSNTTYEYLHSTMAFNYKLTERITAQLAGSYESILTDGPGTSYTRDRFRIWTSLSVDWPRLFSNN